MTALNETAKAALREAGIPQVQWARANWARDGKWSGDVCGCPDSRCANGFHHDGEDDCGCLPTLIGIYREWMSGEPVAIFDDSAKPASKAGESR